MLRFLCRHTAMPYARCYATCLLRRYAFGCVVTVKAYVPSCCPTIRWSIPLLLLLLRRYAATLSLDASADAVFARAAMLLMLMIRAAAAIATLRH